MTLDYDAEVRRIARALSEIAHALESADDMNERVHQTLVLMQDLVPYRQCAFLHVVPDKDPELFVVPTVLLPLERSRLLSMLLRIFRLVAEAEEIGRSAGNVPHLALPVMGLDNVIGVLRVEPSEETIYDARHLRLLSVVAAQLGAYFTMVRLREEDARRTKELAKAHEFQQLLLGVVGHDLRNPLSVITTVASQLLLKKTDDQRQAKNLQRALRNAEKANTIIADLLDVTHVRVTGQMPVTTQRVDLHELLEEIVDDTRVQNPEVDLAWRATDSAIVDCDPVRLSQVATNLFNNALAHGEQGSPVQVELLVGASDVVLSVHNRGPAIPADLLPVIFNPFKQGAQKRRGAGGGLGLGLYIVDQIARAHGGRVDVSSTDAAGTTFTVILPRWHEAAQAPPPKSNDEQRTPVEDSTERSHDGETANDVSHPLVMVVDDDFDIRDGIAELLRQHGFTVSTAANGAEALELLRSGLRPKLILLDLMMPVMDGVTFCNICHDDPVLSSIPVFIISADAASAVKLTRTGATGFLQKPVQIENLLQTLEHASR
jgi:signal transduction histidine kinase